MKKTQKRKKVRGNPKDLDGQKPLHVGNENLEAPSENLQEKIGDHLSHKADLKLLLEEGLQLEDLQLEDPQLTDGAIAQFKPEPEVEP